MADIHALVLDQVTLAEGIAYICVCDPDLERIYSLVGEPPLWERPQGFVGLLRIILEQQVSLASARASFTRLQDALDPLTPDRFLTLRDDQLRAIGFSRQKTAYGRILAQAVLDGSLDLYALLEMPDEMVRQTLIQLKGIGPWTADIYLLLAMRRVDIFPTGDLALATAVQRVKGLEEPPWGKELGKIAEAWQPWRSVAARLLWHYYLSGMP